MSQTGSELLFDVFSRRYENGATIVTSNLPFQEWTSVFASERLTGALLDRITHHVHTHRVGRRPRVRARWPGGERHSPPAGDRRAQRAVRTLFRLRTVHTSPPMDTRNPPDRRAIVGSRRW